MPSPARGPLRRSFGLGYGSQESGTRTVMSRPGLQVLVATDAGTHQGSMMGGAHTDSCGGSSAQVTETAPSVYADELA